MITLLGSLLGFFSAIFPHLLDFLKRKQEHAQEIELIELQADIAKEQRAYKLEEINTRADISETQALYKTYKTGIGWVDAYNGTVRPTIAYGFFLLYAGIKASIIYNGLLWQLWSEEDQAIFAAIISFYFGQRAMNKARNA